MYFGLAMIDIDNFKKINDTYGHDVGDKILINLVSIIENSSRNDDILIRWGGEEFIMILKVSSENGLKIALENLRKTIENSKINNLPQITCSFGGTLYKDNELITDTIKRADESLYVAKNQGKNRIIIK